MDLYQVEFTKSASKDLKHLDRPLALRINEAIKKLRENPFLPGHRKLVGEDNAYRIRVGDYRIIYQIENVVLLILIVKIRHRKDVYR